MWTSHRPNHRLGSILRKRIFPIHQMPTSNVAVKLGTTLLMVVALQRECEMRDDEACVSMAAMKQSTGGLWGPVFLTRATLRNGFGSAAGRRNNLPFRNPTSVDTISKIFSSAGRSHLMQVMRQLQTVLL